MTENMFAAPGQWLKGNLHLHTTASDGTVTPQEAVELYQGAGYDFLSITDHGTVVDVTELDDLGMTLLPGVEIAPAGGELGQTVHTVGVGCGECPEDPQTGRPADQIGPLADASEFCFIAHPAWSSLVYRDFVELPGVGGVEVYNSTCHHGIGRGWSEVQWDDCLARGAKLWGLAVDDAHHKYDDRFYGWIMLKAPDRSPESIYEALRAGSFYASTGPTIEAIELEGDQLRVACSPCVEVFAVCPLPGRGSTTWREDVPDRPFTEQTLTVRETINPVRIVVVDERGRRAWSQPQARQLTTANGG